MLRVSLPHQGMHLARHGKTRDAYQKQISCAIRTITVNSTAAWRSGFSCRRELGASGCRLGVDQGSSRPSTWNSCNPECSQRWLCCPGARHSCSSGSCSNRCAMTNSPTPDLVQKAKPRLQVVYRQSRACEIDSAAAVYAAAFMSDPEIQYIFKDVPQSSDTYKQAVAAMYLKATRVMFCRSGCPSWCAVNVQEQSIVGAAHILPFKHYPSLLTFAAYGLLWGLQWPGLNCLFRALQISDAAAVAAKHAQLAISGELCSIGVLPKHQRQGIGWQLLTNLLQQWDEDDGGGLILYTAKESNVGFYERAGFSVLETRQPRGDDDESGGIKVWYMYRPAGWLTSSRFNSLMGVTQVPVSGGDEQRWSRNLHTAHAQRERSTSVSPGPASW